MLTREERWRKAGEMARGVPGEEHFDFGVIAEALLADPAAKAEYPAASALLDRAMAAQDAAVAAFWRGLEEAFPEADPTQLVVGRRDVEWQIRQGVMAWAQGCVPGFSMKHDEIVRAAEADGLDTQMAEHFAYFVGKHVETRTPHFTPAVLKIVLEEWRRLTGK